MPLSVAQSALRNHLVADGRHDQVLVDLAGGEPMVVFERMREICEWAWEQSWPIPYLFFATTNGTLVHGHAQDWFRQNRHRIWLGLSLDGTPQMHNANRSHSYGLIDIPFFRDTWPKQSVKMTVSRETLDDLATGVAFLHEQGFRVRVNLAYGVDWSDPQAQNVLARELDALVAYYLANPNVEPCSLLTMPMSRLAAPVTERSKWCGAGTDMVAVDVDGREYPCHTFLPLAQGEGSYEVGRIEWTNVDSLKDPRCGSCVLEPLCPTCYGISHMKSGNAWCRDRALCELSKIRALACSKLEAERVARDASAIKSYNRELLLTIKGILRVQQAFGQSGCA
jgi:radical SAM protein with 4Fe4S-binding SPASM domain